jgi:hypothetical protein
MSIQLIQQYYAELLGRVCAVSVETMRIIGEMPE